MLSAGGCWRLASSVVAVFGEFASLYYRKLDNSHSHHKLDHECESVAVLITQSL